MALEQDSDPFGSIPPEDGGAFAPSDASGHVMTDAFGHAPDPASDSHEAPASEPAPSSKRRPRAQRVSRRSPAKLASAVAKLRELEDAIVAHVLAADQLVRRLESRGVHTEAGYSSRADFEQRILASAPLIKSMRDGLATMEPRRARAPTPGARPAAARTRRTKALAAIAQALTKLRERDVAIHRAAMAARDTLVLIESERLFAECGYLSFEEFLERALGPSPVLAASMALAESEPPLTPEEEPEEATEGAFGADGFQETPSLASDFMNDAPAPPASATGPSQPPLAAPAEAAPRARFAGKHIAISLALCVAATFGGGAAGSWSVLQAFARTNGLRANVAVTTTATASAAPVPHPSAPASATANRAPKEKADRAPQAARSLPLDPLAIPVVVPHARPAGPREARR